MIEWTFFPIFRHHNRVHRDNRTTANSIATINSVAAGDMASAINATSETGSVYDATTGQVCDLRYISIYSNLIIEYWFSNLFFFHNIWLLYCKWDHFQYVNCKIEQKILWNLLIQLLNLNRYVSDLQQLSGAQIASPMQSDRTNAGNVNTK